MYHVIFPVGEEFSRSAGPEIRPLIQLWSLSVEEHFYLIAPAVAVIAITRNWTRQLIIACIGFWAFVTVARWATGHVGPRFAWYQRPDSLMLGMALAFVHARMPPQLGRQGTEAPGCLRDRRDARADAHFLDRNGLRPPLRAPGALQPARRRDPPDEAVLGRVRIQHHQRLGVRHRPDRGATTRTGSWPGSSPWKVWTQLGLRSYTIYILHVPLGVILANALEDQVPGGLILLMYLVLLVVGTEIVHRKVEVPFIAMKTKFEHVGSTGADYVAAATDLDT